MLPRGQRLKSAAFDLSFAEGQILRHPLLQLRVRRRQDGQPQVRASFVVPRRTGRAVYRNRLRRVARETYRLHPLRCDAELTRRLEGCDLIFMVARQAEPDSDFGGALEQLLQRAGRAAGVRQPPA